MKIIPSRTFIAIAGFAICSMLMLNSCKKDPLPRLEPGPAELIDSSMFPYKFLAGSYWVYKNDSTGATDSVVVMEATSGWYHTGHMVQYHSMKLHSYGSSETFYYHIHHYLLEGSGSQPLFSGRMIYNTYIPIGYPTLTINGHVFSNVTEVYVEEEAQQFPYDHYSAEWYFCDSIGLAKKVLVTGESWSIDHWNVIR